jgi:hypothetical protein
MPVTQADLASLQDTIVVIGCIVVALLTALLLSGMRR